MAKHSKRYNELAATFDAKEIHSVEDAMEIVQKTATTKFDSSIEIHVNLGINTKKGDQQVRATVTLPHGTGKTTRVAVFTVDPAKEKEAKDAGADIVGDEETIAEIGRTGKIDFDVAVATPDMMSKLAKIAKILGPRGLMPSPKNETVTPNVGKAVEELKKGKVAFKNDDTANVHQAIGKASFTREQLLENYAAFMDVVKRNKPSSSKGTYIKSVTLTSTMGPGVKVSV